MSKLQVEEDIWYAVLDENGYPIYTSNDKTAACQIADAGSCREVIVMEKT